MSDEEKKVKPSLAVWAVFTAGLLAIPVGLVGYRWLDRVNTERVGFTERVRTPGINVQRACAERALIAHYGRRGVRTFDNAIVVQIPAVQYTRTPEKKHVVLRSESNTSTANGSELLVETAFYKARPVVSRYDEIIAGAMSELVDTVIEGCANGAPESARSGWASRCTTGAGYARACPALRPGLRQPDDTRTPIARD